MSGLNIPPGVSARDIPGNDNNDGWRLHKLNRQAKRARNRAYSTKRLADAGVSFMSCNGGAHLIVERGAGLVDFWPGTGAWTCRATAVRGRGVNNLIAHVKVTR